MIDTWAAVDQIKAEVLGKLETVRPPGSITIREYGQRYGVSRDAATAQLERMVKAGRMKKCYVSIPNAAAQVHRTIVYAPVKK